MRALTPRRWIGLALAATLVAAYFAPPTPLESLQLTERVRTVASRTPEAAPRTSVQSGVEVLAIRPRGQDDSAGAQDMFAARDWNPPQEARAAKDVTAAPVEAAPVARQAPALPFKALGRYTDEAGQLVFLQHNDQNLVVRVGDTVALQYKVESLNGTTLTLRYLPLNQTQTIDVGGSN